MNQCIVRSKKKRNIIAGSIIFIGILILWIIWGNTALELNSYTIISEEIPNEFQGYRIAQVSDLHNAEIEKENERLLDMLSEAEPDIIVITGDLIDSRDTNLEIALDFVEKAVEIAPCYYVTGNHEARVSEYTDLKTGLLEKGVTVLEDDVVELEENGERILLIGVNDPSFQTDYLFGDAESVMTSKLQNLINEELYTILLSHRPELFSVYVENGVDLVFSGHAHGGQFRLPFVGGLVAPNQGIFPKYDAGIYTEGQTNMVVSRGIGNSILPIRVNNRPEVVLIELQRNE